MLACQRIFVCDDVEKLWLLSSESSVLAVAGRVSMLIHMDFVEMIPAAFATDDEQTLTVDHIDQIDWHPLESFGHFLASTSWTNAWISSMLSHSSAIAA